jgi:diguanylate cyclase (GGDEF)-like protein
MHNPAVAGPALFLWVWVVVLPATLFANRSETGVRWWTVLGLHSALLVTLALRYRRAGDGQPRSTRSGVINAALLGLSFAAGLWCVAEPRHLLLVYTGIAFMTVSVFPRSHTRNGTIAVTAATYAALLGGVGWSHLALSSQQAVSLGDAVTLYWALGIVAASTRYIATLESTREQLRQQVEASARTDALTGLANRPAFLAAAENAVTAATTGQRCCSLLVIDLDGLKDINDSFGHPVGDAAIRRFGEAIRACAGPEDVIARLGGDEFAVLTFHPPGMDIAAIEAPFRPALEGTLFEDAAVGRTMLLSGSWGTACYPIHGSDVATLFVHADERLLRHKSSLRGTRPVEGVENAPYVPRGRRSMAEALSMLLTMASDVADAVDGEDFLRRSATRAAELLSAMSATVALIGNGTQRGYRAVRSADGWQYVPATFPGKPSIHAYVIETGTSYFSNDLDNDPLVNREAARRLNMRSCLCVPLRGSNRRVIGTIFFTNKLGRAPFNDHDVLVAQAFADLAATALEKTEALAAVREEAAVSKALLGAIGVVHSAGDADQIVAHIVREAMALIDAEIGAVALVRADAMLDITSYRRDGTAVHNPPRVRVGEGIAGHVAATAKPYLSNDLASDPITLRADDEQYSLRSQLSAPVLDSHGVVLAVVSLFNAGGSGFSARHQELLQAFTCHVAVALERARSEQQVG